MYSASFLISEVKQKENDMKNGLSNEIPQIESEGNKISVVTGKFALRVEEGTEGAIARELTKGDNQGKEVHELLYPSLTGLLSSGEIRELPFGLSCEVTVTNEDESYTVQFSSDSKYFTALVTRLPNIDRSIPVSLSLVPHKTKTTKSGNPVIMLLVTQNNKRVDDYYVKWSKDEAGKNIATHLHGLPEVKKTRQGWDFSDQEDFYLGQFERYFSGDSETYTMPDADATADAPKDPVYNTVDTRPPPVDEAAGDPPVDNGALVDPSEGPDNLPF